MAGLIPKSVLDQIRNANDIVEVIGAVLPLKRAGANFVALCPFHREKSPSFNVNPHKQIFHCFGCHKGGDVFTFVREYENLPFIDAARRLAQRANIPLAFENTPGQQQARHLKERLLEIHDLIATRWQVALANDAAGQIARDYLTKRGVSEEAVKLFRLGYSPDAWDDTVNWAKSKGYELPLMEQAGLILHKEEADRYYDRFRGRLMFPICDEQGRVVAFSGRVLVGDEKTAKYVNSPETPIFTKGKVFYGLDKSKRAILDAGFAIICEGQLDLIACYMGGTRNVVAPQGTAFTPDHARILKRYVDEVVLCFDSDNAGQNAAVRVQESLLASGLAIRVATVPAPDDPDSYIKKHGGAAFQELIDKAEGFFDFYLNRLCATNNTTTDKGRLAVVKAMAEAVMRTQSAVLSDTYAQKTAQRLGVSAQAVREEFRRAPKPRPMVERAAPPAPGPVSVAPTASPDPDHPPADYEPDEATLAPTATDEVVEVPPPSEREFWLLRFLMASEESATWAARHLQLEWVEHPVVRRLVAARLSAHESHTWRGVPGLMDDLEDDFARSLLTEAVAEDVPTANVEQNLRETVQRLRHAALDRQLAALRIRLAEPGLSEANTAAILRQQSELRRAKQSPWPNDCPPN